MEFLELQTQDLANWFHLIFLLCLTLTNQLLIVVIVMVMIVYHALFTE